MNDKDNRLNQGKARERQILSEGIRAEDVIATRRKDGWTPVAIEWERDEPGEGSHPHAADEVSKRVPVPYGLRVASDCAYLEPEPREQETMETALAHIAADEPLSTVAAHLNERGFHTREGAQWTQVSLFRLLPRLIETAPDVFRSEHWSQMRVSVR